MDRNPSPPPESADQEEDEALDSIGDTVYSKHWLFSTLTRLIHVRGLMSHPDPRLCCTTTFLNPSPMFMSYRWSQKKQREALTIKCNSLMRMREIYVKSGIWQWTRFFFRYSFACLWKLWYVTKCIRHNTCQNQCYSLWMILSNYLSSVYRMWPVFCRNSKLQIFFSEW